MTKTFLCQPSGSGISERAWEIAEETGAAWVGNEASAHITLLRSTVEQELAFGMEQDGVPPEIMRQRIAKAASQWGLESLLGRDPSRLSTGQTRRVAIASALLRSPQALVLDCPLDGCDEAAVETLRHVIDTFDGDVTIVDRTWNPLAELCDVHSTYPAGVEIDPRSEKSWSDPAVSSEEEETPELQPLTQPTARVNKGHPTTRVNQGQENGETSTVVSIENLTIRRHAFTLGPVTATIKPGITHIAGPNGKGKTTLLLALADLIDHSGKPFDLKYGWAPTAMDSSFSRKTVLQEVALGSTEEHARIAIEFCGVSGFAETHPLDVPSSERRLVSLACAVVRGPSFLFLDEPTVGLDVYGYRELDRIMHEFVEGELHSRLERAGLPVLGPARSVVWTCHNAPFAELSDHRLVL